MDDLQLFILIFCGSFGGIGLIFLFVSILVSLVHRKKEKNCTAHTVATVINVIKKLNTTSHSHSHSYYPVFQYTTASGQSVCKQYNFGTNPPKYKVGQNVEICYDPQKCNVFYVSNDKISKTFALIFGLIGAGMIAIAVIVGIVLTLNYRVDF